MKIIPFHDYVLIRPSQRDTIEVHGLVLPATAMDEPERLTVVAISPELEGVDLALSDKVIAARFAGQEVEIDGTKLRFVKISDLLGKMVDTDLIPG